MGGGASARGRYEPGDEAELPRAPPALPELAKHEFILLTTGGGGAASASGLDLRASFDERAANFLQSMAVLGGGLSEQEVAEQLAAWAAQRAAALRVKSLDSVDDEFKHILESGLEDDAPEQVGAGWNSAAKDQKALEAHFHGDAGWAARYRQDPVAALVEQLAALDKEAKNLAQQDEPDDDRLAMVQSLATAKREHLRRVTEPTGSTVAIMLFDIPSSNRSGRYCQVQDNVYRHINFDSSKDSDGFTLEMDGESTELKFPWVIGVHCVRVNRCALRERMMLGFCDPKRRQMGLPEVIFTYPVLEETFTESTKSPLADVGSSEQADVSTRRHAPLVGLAALVANEISRTLKCSLARPPITPKLHLAVSGNRRRLREMLTQLHKLQEMADAELEYTSYINLQGKVDAAAMSMMRAEATVHLQEGQKWQQRRWKMMFEMPQAREVVGMFWIDTAGLSD